MIAINNLGMQFGKRVLFQDVRVVTGVKKDGTNAQKFVSKKYISEGNLYRLIMKSKLKSACKFERWVCDEVIPSIRKHGAYIEKNLIDEMLENPDLIISLAQRLKNERLKVNALNKVIIENEEYRRRFQQSARRTVQVEYPGKPKGSGRRYGYRFRDRPFRQTSGRAMLCVRLRD